MKIIDLHSHTFWSDGIATPVELLRYAQKNNYYAFGITDHVDMTNYKEVIDALIQLNEDVYDLIFIPGIEITHVHPLKIEKIVQYARDKKIKWIGVHGETIVEPVIKGTNSAAIDCCVDFLAHPGFISEEDSLKAEKNKVFLELTMRCGHSLTNAFVFNMGKKHNCNFIISSDAHKPSELFNNELYKGVALGCGMSLNEFEYYNNIYYNFIEKIIN